MYVKVIAELNPLSTKRITLITTPKPVSDIILEFNTGFSLSQARVIRNGEIVTDFSVLACDGDTLWVKFVPQGGNPESLTYEAGVGSKIAGAALMIVGAVIIAALGWTGVAGFAGAALIGTGIGLVATGGVFMNMDITIPSVKERETPEQDPSIRGGKNQTRPHGRVPVLFGRHRIYPDIAANPHTLIIGGDQYFTQLFCGGYKDAVIDKNSFKLGETLLADLSQTKNIDQILQGGDPLVKLEIIQNGETSSLYPHCVHEEAINAPLQNMIEDSNGNKISGEFISTTPDKTDTINVDIFFFNGLGRYNNDGDLLPAVVEVRAYYKKYGDGEYQLLGNFNTVNESNIIVGAELKTKRFQVTKSGLTPGKYSVKVERVTPDSSSSKIIDQVCIGSIRSIKSTRPIRAERQRDLTIIALRVRATRQLNGVVDSFNFVATSKLPVYSGGGTGPLYWLLSEETRNPASMLLYALRGRAAQQVVNDDDIDWPAFENFFSWCEEHKYTCNAYLSEPVTIASLLRMIGATSRADILRIDSKISVVQDIERPAPVQLFTPKNTKGYSTTMFSADIPEAISMRFIDEESGFAQQERTVHNTQDGLGANEPRTVQKSDLWGITDSSQAWRIGRYTYGCLNLRPFVHSIDVDIEYLMCNKGDWVQYAGDIALTGAAQGRIIEPLYSGGLCVGIRVDEPVEMENGFQYAVRLRMSNANVLLKDVAVTNSPNEIYFVEPFDNSYSPGEGDVYAYGRRGKEVIDLIITDIQPQADLSATLTCVEYSRAIFDVDKPGFIMPEFENKITPVSGAIDSGVVNPNQWKLFVTYHDSEVEPPRPAGDGQENGWHYAQTLRSVWQSSKMAESVSMGEWGPPARIKNTRDNTDVVPVYLTLSPRQVALESDGDGNILAGSLPFTSQAALYKWNHRIPLFSGIQFFPGTEGDLFDPMVGDLFPVGLDVEYFLSDAPEGVSIRGEGLITVSAGAKLEDENSITVQAKYQDSVYTAVLFVTRERRSAAARYLGVINTLSATANIIIIKGTVQGQVRARQGDFVLAVAGGVVGSLVWRAGYVYQWTGFAWAERAPDSHADLYTRCFKDGLDVPELTQDMGWFGAVFCRMLWAQQAFIEQLQTRLITLEAGGVIQSKDFPETGEGFRLQANGEAVFSRRVTARDIRILGNSLFEGDIISGLIYSSNTLTGADIPPVIFGSNQNARDVYMHFGLTFPQQGSFPVIGTWGTGDTIRSVSAIYCYAQYVGIGSSMYQQYEIRITLVSPNEVIESKWNSYSNISLGKTLSIGGGKRGAILKLTGLPGASSPTDPSLMEGEVFKDLAGYLRVRI